MSLDYRSLNSFPIVRSFSANTNNTQIQVPSTANYMTIQTPDHKILISFEGEDGGAPSSHHIHLVSGGSAEFRLGRGYNRSISVYIATESSSAADVNLIFEE